MSLHVIRLRNPWQRVVDATAQVNSATTDEARERSVAMACSLPFDFRTASDSSTATRLRRLFHRPTGLTAKTCVTLVIEHTGGPVCVRLNGESVGELKPHVRQDRFDITARLAEPNLVELVADASGLVVSSARLEIQDGMKH